MKSRRVMKSCSARFDALGIMSFGSLTPPRFLHQVHQALFLYLSLYSDKTEMLTRCSASVYNFVQD